MTIRKYTKEFKEEAVKLVTEQGYSRSKAAQVLGTDSKNVSRWVILHRGNESSPTMQAAPEKEEIVRLRKENERLKMEREILKKAAAFFANERL